MASAENFDITATADSDGVRLRVQGELDVRSARQLVAAVETARARQASVVLDLSALSFMDSTGLQALMGLVGQAKAEGWNLGLSPTFQPAVSRVLEITGVLPSLPLLDE